MRNSSLFVVSGVLTAIALGVLLHTNIIHLPITQNTDAVWAYDFSDDRVLVGSSHDVFAGKVTKKIGQRMVDEIPVSTYEIQVVSSIKGSLNGVVTIEQAGGYENGILQTFENGKLLKEGSTYLLATRNQENGPRFLLTYLAGNVLISNDAKLDAKALATLAQAHPKYKAFTNAYPSEILDPNDVQSGTAYNSYSSTAK